MESHLVLMARGWHERGRAGQEIRVPADSVHDALKRNLPPTTSHTRKGRGTKNGGLTLGLVGATMAGPSHPEEVLSFYLDSRLP